MALSARHVAAGIDAVIDSAHVVTPHDVWVDVEDVDEAIRQVEKLRDSVLDKPEVYVGDMKGSVCIRL